MKDLREAMDLLAAFIDSLPPLMMLAATSPETRRGEKVRPCEFRRELFEKAGQIANFETATALFHWGPILTTDRLWQTTWVIN